MNATVEEWIAKAEGDYATAVRELGAAGLSNYDAVCFHAEQCIEKLMKALLIQTGVTPTRTHDLTALDRLLGAACPGWSWTAEELRFLTRAAVAFRYPGKPFQPRTAVVEPAIVTEVGYRDTGFLLFHTPGRVASCAEGAITVGNHRGAIGGVDRSVAAASVADSVADMRKRFLIEGFASHFSAETDWGGRTMPRGP